MQIKQAKSENYKPSDKSAEQSNFAISSTNHY